MKNKITASNVTKLIIGLAFIGYINYTMKTFNYLKIERNLLYNSTHTINLHTDSRNDKSFEQHYFPSDCKCQSLFTLNACNDKQLSIGSYNLSDADKESFAQNLQKYRNGVNNNMGELFTNYIRYIKDFYALDINFQNNSTFNFSGRDINENSASVLPENELVSCGVHKYTTSDIKKCTRLFKKETGKPLRIYFVGDSMIRTIMEEIVKQTFVPLNLKFEKTNFNLNVSEDFLDHKTKRNIFIGGGEIEVRLYWAPFLRLNTNPHILDDIKNHGAKDLLEKWAKRDLTSHEEIEHPVPHILYIGGGIWDSLSEKSIDAIEYAYYRDEILKETLTKLFTKTRILWHFHPKIRYWMQKRVAATADLKMMNQMSWLQLKDSPLWFWDTLALLSVKETKQCEYFVKSGLLDVLPKEWNCFDPEHPGKIPRESSVNMIWNLACNKILKLNQNLCCS